MTLEQLRIFVAVAEREHVTQASRAINLTQSATSAAIAAIERRHQTKLFDRIGRRVALTDVGRVFLEEAKAVLARAAMAEATLADFAGLKRGSLSIAASQTIGNYWLPKFLCRFGALHPGVDLKLLIGNTRMVASLARESGVDIGFVEGNVDDPALAAEPVAEDELILVAAPEIASALGALEMTNALRGARWIVRESGSGTREIFEAALPALGLAASDLTIALELPSNEAVCAAAQAGAGVAALSKLVVENALKAGSLRALPLALPKRRFFSLRLKERSATTANRAFCALIRDEAPSADD